MANLKDTIVLGNLTVTGKITGAVDNSGGSGVSVINSNPTLSWGSQSTVATVGSTAITLTMPGYPNKVAQDYSTTNKNYPLLFSATDGISSTSSRGDTTTLLNNSIYVNPSSGSLAGKIVAASSYLHTTGYISVYDDGRLYWGDDLFDGLDIDTNYYSRGIIVNGDYYLNFPAKSGTFALTNDISGVYLPLAGGLMNGPIQFQSSSLPEAKPDAGTQLQYLCGIDAFASGGMMRWESASQVINRYAPKPTDYYWANVKVSSASSTSTSPTFATMTSTHASTNRISSKTGAGSKIYIGADCDKRYILYRTVTVGTSWTTIFTPFKADNWYGACRVFFGSGSGHGGYVDLLHPQPDSKLVLVDGYKSTEVEFRVSNMSLQMKVKSGSHVLYVWGLGVDA